MVFFITALRRIGRGIYSKLFDGFFFVGLMGWDFSLALVNLITFKRKVGRVTPKGQPGEGGVWPEYSPPRKGDSRCSCPALNAMANHGVFYFFFHRYPQWINTSCMPLPYPRGCFYVSLPPLCPGIIARDGRDISFRDLSTQIRATYNFSPSFCLFVPRDIAKILNRSYSTGRFDLSDIDVHNGIEHDASLVRKCQSTIAVTVPVSTLGV